MGPGTRNLACFKKCHGLVKKFVYSIPSTYILKILISGIFFFTGVANDCSLAPMFWSTMRLQLFDDNHQVKLTE